MISSVWSFSLTLTPIKFSRPSTTPHGENPIQTISDLAFGDFAKSASPTCLTTPRNLIQIING